MLRRVDARASLLVEPKLTTSDSRRRETVVYLAVQELVDAAGQQRASAVSVSLWHQDDSLAFAVEHDQPSHSPAASRTLSSADRVAALGGYLRTEPAPLGTKVTGVVPLAPLGIVRAGSYALSLVHDGAADPNVGR